MEQVTSLGVFGPPGMPLPPSGFWTLHYHTPSTLPCVVQSPELQLWWILAINSLELVHTELKEVDLPHESLQYSALAVCRKSLDRQRVAVISRARHSLWFDCAHADQS